MLSTLTTKAPHRNFPAQGRHSARANRRSSPSDKSEQENRGPSRQFSAHSSGQSSGLGVQEGPVALLLPIMGVVSIAFLVIGLALPVLPLHVHQGLGLGKWALSPAVSSWLPFSRGCGRATSPIAGAPSMQLSLVCWRQRWPGCFTSSRFKSSACPGYPSQYCCSVAGCWAGPKASSLRVRPAGDWLHSVKRGQEGS